MMRGIGQKQVARLLGHTSTAQVSQWERGAAMPGAVNLIRLCIIYATSPEELYHDVFKEQLESIASRKQVFNE